MYVQVSWSGEGGRRGRRRAAEERCGDEAFAGQAQCMSLACRGEMWGRSLRRSCSVHVVGSQRDQSELEGVTEGRYVSVGIITFAAISPETAEIPLCQPAVSRQRHLPSVIAKQSSTNLQMLRLSKHQHRQHKVHLLQMELCVSQAIVRAVFVRTHA